MKTKEMKTVNGRGMVIAMVMSDLPTGGKSNRHDDNERDRDQRSGRTEQPTNNKPASGERGNKEGNNPRAQKTAGKGDRNSGPNRNR